MRRLVIAVTLLVAASFAQNTLYTQNFNGNWRTNNPPTGWRIFHTGGGPMGRGDWDRQVGLAPWNTHPTPFAGIYPQAGMDGTPDSLISPTINCSGYMNVTILCSTNFIGGPNAYQAQILYSIDGGVSFPYLARNYHNVSTGTICETLVLDRATDQANVKICWVFYGDLNNITSWFVDDLIVTGEPHPPSLLLYENFNTNWSTGNPPFGWRIFHTGPGFGADDWHREDALAPYWNNHPSPYAAIKPGPGPDTPPDSLISPVINCAGFRNITLTCSTLFYYLSGQPYTAQLVYSTDNGATWPYVLHDYRVDHASVPILESLRLDNAAGKPQVRLAWVYNGDISLISWWSLDDVIVTGDSSPAYDAACDSIVWPYSQVPPLRILPGQFRPAARFSNQGDSSLVNIPVVCSLYTNTMVGLQRWTATIPSLTPGETTTVTFAPPYNLPIGQYFIKFYSDLAIDQNHSNDAIARFFEVSPLIEVGYDNGAPFTSMSWPVGHNGWGARFDADTSPVYIESLKVYLSAPNNPVYCGYQLAVFLDDGAGHPGKLYFKTPVKYATSGVNAWNSVFVGGVGHELVMPNGQFYVFYLQVGEAPECPRLGTDHGPRNTHANYWEYRSGVMRPVSPPGNYMIRALVNVSPVTPVPVDLRTLYVDQPLYDFVQRPFNAPITPRARIENFGSTGATVAVKCSIFGTAGGYRYSNTQTLGSVSQGQDTLVTFSNWVPTRAERCSVIVTTLASGDLAPQNDQKRFAVDVLKGAHTGRSRLGYDWIDSDTTLGPTYSWIDTAGFTKVGELGDNNYVTLQLGMDFPFYDSTYNKVVVSSNGWVALGGTNPGGDLDTVANRIPIPAPPNRCVYAWWDNLAVGAGFGHGNIYYRWFDVAPNRYTVIVFEDAVRVGADTSNGVTFELIFHENGIVNVQYKDVETGNLTFDNAKNATIGLENKNGSDGLCYLYSRPPNSGGVTPIANRLSPGRAIKFYPERRDAAARAIIRPDYYEFAGKMFTPQAKIQNVGTVSDSIRVFMHIGPYSDDTLITDLLAGDSTMVYFRDTMIETGTYTAACSVHMVGDVDPTNNLVTKTSRIGGWVRRADIPPQWRKRKVKSAAMVYAATTQKVYAMKGSGTNELWVYDPAADSWDTLASMPVGPSGKKPRDGVHFTFDPDHGTQGLIWAIKGTNKPDFYCYDIAKDSWFIKANMIVIYHDWPYYNRSYRAPRRGAAIAYVAEAGTQGSVYGMPGNGTNWFWQYDIATNTWAYPHDSVKAENNGVPYFKYIPLDIPGGPFGIRCKYGSGMTNLNGKVYVLKGTNTVEAYGFDPIRNAWTETLDMNSFYGMGFRRVKNGGALTSQGQTLFALKGSNTQQFWHYNFASDSWKRNSDIPVAFSGRRVRPKLGAALAGAESTIYCLKGSSSYEFWEYRPVADTVPLLAGPEPSREGVMAEVAGLDLSKPWLTAYPNPTRLGLNISYNITSTATTRLRVYDAAGKVVTNLWDAARPSGQYLTHWNGMAADGTRVPAGIYFVKLESGDTRLTQKLIIQR
jgi:hypothetical protein